MSPPSHQTTKKTEKGIQHMMNFKFINKEANILQNFCIFFNQNIVQNGTVKDYFHNQIKIGIFYLFYSQLLSLCLSNLFPFLFSITFV